MKISKAKIKHSKNFLQSKKTNQPFFFKTGHHGNGESTFFSETPTNQNSFFVPQPFIQTKLSIGQPSDKYEHEADAMANKVANQTAVNGSLIDSSSIQTKCMECEQEERVQKMGIEEKVTGVDKDLQKKSNFENNGKIQLVQKLGQPKAESTPMIQTAISTSTEEEKLQQKEEDISENDLDIEKRPIFESNAEPPPEENTIQAKSDDSRASASLENRLNATKGSGQPLPENIQSSVGNAMGADFSGVGIHTGSDAVQMNKELGAQAFAHGSDIYFNEGKYDTGSSSGKRLLAHELTHTVQQGGTIRLKIQKSEEEPTDLVNDQPVLQRYKGKDINKAGKISAPSQHYNDAVALGMKIRSTPTTSKKYIGRIRYNETVFIKASNYSGGWVYVVALNGTAGWINQDFVAMDMPDPLSTLHHVIEPNLETALVNHYQGKFQFKTGNDLRVLAAGILVANNGRRGVQVDWGKYFESMDDYYWRNLADPWFKVNRAIYHSVQIGKGLNIWLPSVGYIERLKASGKISTRPEWVNDLVDIGKGTAGFIAGIFEGFFGSLIDALEGLWDMVKGVIDTVGKILTGEIINDIEGIYDFFKNLTWEKAKELAQTIISTIVAGAKDFYANWTHANTYKKWNFRGKVVGTILLEVLLAIFTAGAGNALKWIGKIGKIAPKLFKVLQKAIRKIEKVLPDSMKNRRKDLDFDDSTDNKAVERKKALLMASAIAETHDARDSSIAVLLASLAPLKTTFKVVKGHSVKPKVGKPGHYEVHQIQRSVVDKDYSPEKTDLSKKKPGEKFPANETFTDNGYTYSTNEHGWVSKVEGKLKLKTGKRKSNPKQTEVGKLGKQKKGKGYDSDADEGGHLIGDRFDGSGNTINLIPQNANLNRSKWKAMENEWAKAIRQGKKVKVEIEIFYNGNNIRPDELIVKYQIGKKKVIKEFINQKGG